MHKMQREAMDDGSALTACLLGRTSGTAFPSWLPPSVSIVTVVCQGSYHFNYRFLHQVIPSHVISSRACILPLQASRQGAALMEAGKLREALQQFDVVVGKTTFQVRGGMTTFQV